MSNIDKLELKPKPTNITTISKKAKVAILGGVLGAVSIIAIGVSYDSKPVANTTELKKKEVTDVELTTVGDLDKVFKEIPDGRSDLNKSTEPEIKLDVAQATKPTDVKTEQPKIDLSNSNALAPAPSVKPVDTMAEQLKMMKAQMKNQAIMATTKVAGASGNGASANGIGGLPAGINSTMDAINQRLAQVQQAGQGSVQAIQQSQAQQNDDQNKQLRKEQFLASAEQGDLSKPNYLASMKQVPLSKYEIKAGFVMPAVMLTGVSSDLPGQMIAQVRENIYDSVTGEYLLIPQGSKILGSYDSQVAYGQQRLLIVWNRLIFPDGGSMNLGGMLGADGAGYSGLKDQVDNHYMKIYGSAVAMSMITAGVSLTQPKQQSSNGTPSAQETMAQALGQALGSTTNAILNKNINIQPTLEIRPGMKFNVVITKDMILPSEYKQ